MKENTGLKEPTPLHAIVATGYFGFETRIEIIWHRAKPNIGHACLERNNTKDEILTIVIMNNAVLSLLFRTRL